MAFYSVNYLQELVSAPSVYAPEFTLTEETHTEFEYPVGGWWWFDTLEEATAILIPVITPTNNDAAADQSALDAINAELAKGSLTMARLRTAILAGEQARIDYRAGVV